MIQLCGDAEDFIKLDYFSTKPADYEDSVTTDLCLLYLLQDTIPSYE